MELCDVTCAVTQCRQSELRDTQLEEWEEVLTITPHALLTVREQSA